MNIKRLIFGCISIFLILPEIVKADRYEVLFTNSSQIMVKGKSVKVGIIFEDQDEIKWTSNKQAFKARNLRTGRKRIFAQELFAKSHTRTIRDFLVCTKRLSTRDFQKADDNPSEFVVDSINYLLDELIINGVEVPTTSFYDEVVCVINQDTIVTKLNTYSNEPDIVVPRSIFGNYVPLPVYINIRRTEPEWNWTYLLYKNLYVLPLPLNNQ